MFLYINIKKEKIWITTKNLVIKVKSVRKNICPQKDNHEQMVGSYLFDIARYNIQYQIKPLI